MSEPSPPHRAQGQGAPLRRPYRRLSPLTPLVRGFILLVAVLASTWDDLLRGDLGPFAWLLLAILVAGAAYGAASWLRTKYWVESDELRVDTGVVSRQSRRIRVDRLQGIDIVQPFVARLFGLAELRMDVAGGRAREGSLAFLPLREAHELRETLLARRDAVRAGAPGQAGATARTAGQAGGSGARPAPTPERVLARLDLGTLLLSLLLSAETLVFLLAAALVAGAFVVFGQLGGVAGVVPVVVGFALAQFRKLSAYYDFTVVELGTVGGPSVGVQLRRGLFERSNQTIMLVRVQGVVVSEPLLWRRFGWARLDVAVAGYAGGHDNGPSASTVMPVAPRPLVLALSRTLLAGSLPGQAVAGPGAGLDAVPLTTPPPRARWAAPVWWRFQAGGVGDDLAVGREGIWTRRTHVVPHARVQSLQVRQGPWQRRLRLADLRVDSPPGPVALRMRHRDAGEVRALLEREDALARRARLSAG